MGIAISSKRFFTGVVWHTYSHDANFPVQLVVCFNSWSSPPTRLVRKMTIPYLDLCRKVTYLHINGLLSPPTPKGLHGSSPPPPFLIQSYHCHSIFFPMLLHVCAQLNILHVCAQLCTYKHEISFVFSASLPLTASRSLSFYLLMFCSQTQITLS